MKISSLLCLLLAGAYLSLAGCGNSKVIRNPADPMVGRGADFVDWNDAAQELSKRLIESGRIVVPPGKTKVVIAVSVFKNDTTDPDLPVQLLFNKVCAAITTDKIQPMAFDQVAVAAARLPALAAGEAADKAAFLGTPSPAPQLVSGPDGPDYTLDGDITSIKADAGHAHTRTYDFHMRLNDTRTGLTPWQDSTHVTKQWTRSRVGG